MIAVTVAFFVGKRFERCIIAFCAPGPPKAMRHIAGRKSGAPSMELHAKRMDPAAMHEMEIIEHTRGPYMSRMIPNNRGPIKLKKDATVHHRTKGIND